MNEKLKVAIQQWQVAHALAKGNPGLLLNRTYTEENSRLAQARMKDLDKAESELFSAMSAANSSEIPGPLLEWRATYLGVGTESACGGCWLSSTRREKKHPECVSRIKRFFDARNAMESL